jgi:hypothetical protein
MRKILPLFLLAAALLSAPSCSKKSEEDPKCGTYNGKTVYLGPQGGCYYYNSQGNKEYVARNFCNC